MPKKVKVLAWIVICCILGVIFLLPFIWMLSTSLMGTEQIVKYPPEIFPSPFTKYTLLYVF